MTRSLSVTNPMANIEDTAPKASAADVAHAAVKGAIAALPVLGGGASELFSLVLAPPLSKRKDEWMESIADALKNLQEQVDGFSIDDLKDDQGFITTMANASQIAVRNHQSEKLRALRNAVLNSALQNEPDDDIRAMFLSCVDSFTEWHLRILKFLDNPQDWLDENQIPAPNIYTGATSTVLYTAFPALQGNKKFADLVVKELYSKGLLNVDSLHTMTSFAGVMAQRTTELGRRFLDFISEPDV